jgi:CRISPR/Cas system-associated exonuclease Cas4 (RecB family)
LTDSGQSRVLKASEIGSYAYCARGWWLSRVLGYRSAHTERMATGEESHLSHGRKLVGFRRLEGMGYLLMGLGGFLALIALVWWIATDLTG